MHGVNQRERLIPMSVYRKELAKARLGDNIANHMGFIFTAVLYDKFDMTFKQVTNFYSKTVERRKAWQDDAVLRVMQSLQVNNGFGNIQRGVTEDTR